jgi:antitoxin component of RelBE/YafQ-DinJ toxin-antitoxin module
MGNLYDGNEYKINICADSKVTVNARYVFAYLGLNMSAAVAHRKPSH